MTHRETIGCMTLISKRSAAYADERTRLQNMNKNLVTSEQWEPGPQDPNLRLDL